MVRAVLCTTLAVVCAIAAEPRVREPAVAGLFYPRGEVELRRTIDRLLDAAKTERRGELKALICPHAGYAYSGPIAASGFRLLRGLDVRTIVLLAPSHYAALRAASVSNADVYRTPLGDVPISHRARELVRRAPFEFEPRCVVERPDWARQSSRAIPEGNERADTWEHSDEVEVPFLQRTLARFDLLPIVCGEIDPRAAAEALAPVLDETTLIVASSDLSHYHPYERARTLDRECIDAICALDLARVAQQEACGLTPLLTLLHVAKARGWQPVLLDYRNSGDTAGDRSRVVGYAAIAFYAQSTTTAASESASSALSTEERRLLLALARRTVRAASAGEPLPSVPAVELTPRLLARRACFVTLTKAGALRGCIGHLAAVAPLHQSVIENARSAAIRDPRFLPMSGREVPELQIEISVLTEPAPLAFSSPEDLLRSLHPHRDGVILRVGDRSATYLPQVWEQIPGKSDFLDSLAEKAGLPASAWRRRDAAVFIYHVESFKEIAP